MTIYIDNDNKCHVSDDGTRRAFDVPFFDGKCTEFVEGYRYVPTGESWTRADGEVFAGEMIAPYRDYSQIAEIQSAVNRTQDETVEMIGGIVNGNEESFVATHNYEAGELILINNIAYKAIKNILHGRRMIVNQDIVITTISNYVEENKK